MKSSFGGGTTAQAVASILPLQSPLQQLSYWLSIAIQTVMTLTLCVYLDKVIIVGCQCARSKRTLYQLLTVVSSDSLFTGLRESAEAISRGEPFLGNSRLEDEKLAGPSPSYVQPTMPPGEV